MSTYTFPNAWELGKRRMELLEACHDAKSIERATALGVGPGWQCLDAGAGGGSFSRWLAARVAPGGRVLAVDLDTRLLEAEPAPGLEIRSLDIERSELPLAAFDLVHTRLLLLHLREREAVLRRLAAAVRPGGVLLVEEDDIHPLAAATGAYREAWDAVLEFTGAAGLDGEWARNLPERLGQLGLADVGAEIDTQLFPGGSLIAQFWSLTWLQARDGIVARGIPGEVIDRGRAALDDSTRWFHGPAKVIAWGRRR